MYVLGLTDCTLQLLLDAGVDIGINDNDGMSALMWCCHGDHLDHLRLLLKQVHADDGLTDRDVSGKTWLHWCVRRIEPLNCLQVGSQFISRCSSVLKSITSLCGIQSPSECCLYFQFDY